MEKKECTTCESCLMPFSKDPGIRESDTYCSYCFKDGKLCYEGTDLKEFQSIVYKNMRSKGIGYVPAKFYTWVIKFAPRWKNKK
jgi:hypothetical protein